MVVDLNVGSFVRQVIFVYKWTTIQPSEAGTAELV